MGGALSPNRTGRLDTNDLRLLWIMPDPRTLAETESAMNRHIEGLEIDFAAAHTVSSIYRAANAIRAHITNAVLRQYDLTWSGFVVMWVWIWDGMETRHVAESAAISKGTLTGVVTRWRAAAGLSARVWSPTVAWCSCG